MTCAWVEDFASGVPAASISYMELNRDGQPDMVIIFDTAALREGGLLGPDTEELNLFIRDSSTGQIYCVTVAVTLFAF
jgi:hypothetical protein